MARSSQSVVVRVWVLDVILVIIGAMALLNVATGVYGLRASTLITMYQEQDRIHKEYEQVLIRNAQVQERLGLAYAGVTDKLLDNLGLTDSALGRLVVEHRRLGLMGDPAYGIGGR